MTTKYRSAGKTTLTPDVLLTIARMAALEAEGVKEMAPVKAPPKGSFGRLSDGVRIVMEGSNVFVDLYVVLKHDVNIREVGRDVQQHVARALAEMTGLEVGLVNVHIQDIDFPAEAQPAL
jgi:uncharacterized alkaline shock family protein YloU